MRHFDFQRIYDEFCSYYRDKSKGESEYYSWVKALDIDEAKPYGHARESFKWAKSMLNFLREDAENKYYGVIVGMPWRSMNGNVYRERDLIAAALSLKGKHPSVNHKPEFWLSPSNPHNKWGTVTVEDAKYEEGAIEAVLKVPKTATCPVCPRPNSTLTSLIDEQHIVNVSLEGTMNGAFEFTDPPFTLLTSDVLPGIPLARIKPLERIMVEALQFQQSKGETKTLKIKATVKEETVEETRVVVDQPGATQQSGVDRRDDTRGSWGTPVTSDINLHGNTDSSGNTTVQVGESPANKVMQSGNPMTGKANECKGGVCEPFAGYTDMDDCVAKNGDKEDPSAYCASIMQKAEPTENLTGPLKGYTDQGPSRTQSPSRSTPEYGSLPGSNDQTVVMGTPPAATSVWTGESPVSELLSEQVNRIRAETREAIAHDETEKLRDSMQKVEAIWSEKYLKLSEAHQKQTATNTQQELIIKDQREAIRKEQLRTEDTRVELRDIKNQFADSTSIQNKQAHLMEDLKIENAELNKKYHGTLEDNLKLSKDVTRANEDYLAIAKKLENTEEALKRAIILAKKTTKITA